jgi:hypothetical protein
LGTRRSRLTRHRLGTSGPGATNLPATPSPVNPNCTLFSLRPCLTGPPPRRKPLPASGLRAAKGSRALPPPPPVTRLPHPPAGGRFGPHMAGSGPLGAGEREVVALHQGATDPAERRY